MHDVEVVHGPTINAVRPLVYQVTLTSGMIVTSPEGFAATDEDHEPPVPSQRPIVADDGRVLAVY